MQQAGWYPSTEVLEAQLHSSTCSMEVESNQEPNSRISRVGRWNPRNGEALHKREENGGEEEYEDEEENGEPDEEGEEDVASQDWRSLGVGLRRFEDARSFRILKLLLPFSALA